MRLPGSLPFGFRQMLVQGPNHFFQLRQIRSKNLCDFGLRAAVLAQAQNAFESGRVRLRQRGCASNDIAGPGGRLFSKRDDDMAQQR